MKKSFLCFLLLIATSFHCIAASKEFHSLMLTSRQQRNLEVLSSMYGYARSFYPNPQLDKVDWHGFLINVLPPVLEASDDDELIPVLHKKFALIMDNFYISSQDIGSNAVAVCDTVQCYYVKENKVIPSIKMTSSLSTIRKVE